MASLDRLGLIGRRPVLAGLLALPSFKAFAAGDPADGAVSTSDAQTLLNWAVQPAQQSLGYVAALADNSPWEVITAGRPDNRDGRPMDGDSVFEVGSITKVFTGLLLADMVERGELQLDDPVAKFLPPEGRPEPFDGKPITLIDLATHTSGLSHDPANAYRADGSNPYSSYTVADLYHALSTYGLSQTPGSSFSYSNFGYSVLGQALSLRAGRSYADLVTSRICDPLGLASTRVAPMPSMQERLVPGHDPAFQPVPRWTAPAVLGAGAMLSSANDLARFVDAFQGRVKTPLAPAMARMLSVRRPTNTVNSSAAIGWFILDNPEGPLIWKDGDTGGYASYVGYRVQQQSGVVLLSNTRSWVTTPRIGRHMLDQSYPVPEMREPIQIDASLLQSYSGTYWVPHRILVHIAARNGYLDVKATGYRETEIFPITNKLFFAREDDAQVLFNTGAGGKITGFTMMLGGQHIVGTRAN